MSLNLTYHVQLIRYLQFSNRFIHKKTVIMSTDVIIKEKDIKHLTLFRNQSLYNHTIVKQNFISNVKQITHWEELECLGYNPELSRVEAIVNIKQSGGYSGNLCSLGSPEYVRFFIDYNDGSGFQDLGVSSFRAHNISDAPPGPQHPISYMVSKEINSEQHKKFCGTEVLVTLRAVLSWNSIPSNDPNELPTYGNVLDAEAVLKPLKFNIIYPLPLPIQPINPVVKEYIDFELKKEKVEVNIPDLIKTNLEMEVSPGRIMSQVVKISKNEKITFPKDIIDFDLPELGIDPNELIEELEQQKFNTNYEEIVSVGMNTAQDTFGAVINIKRPVGYGGNLCKNGSLEYVSFFADFNNNGVFEKYLGTSHVKVNDIQNIPAGGLMYGVFLKTDLSKYLKPCNRPQIVRIRAILSWATPPTSDPEQHVNWGNSMDVLVQLRPKKTDQTSIIYSVGNVAIEEISPSSCLAYPGNTGMRNNRPWGGMITIKGGIDNSGAPGTTKYRVEYSQNGVDYLPVTLKQNVTTINFTTETSQNHVLEDANGWFPYLANHDASNLIVIKDQVLATWPSHNFEGKYYIRVSYTKSDPIANPSSIQHSTPIRIQLDNRRFRPDDTSNNSLDVGFDVDMKVHGGVCKVYNQGDILSGDLKVVDQYYGGYRLSVQPATQIINSAGLINYNDLTILDNADPSFSGPTNEPFAIDTGKLKKCGYALRLRGFERTILNNRHDNPYADKYVGFSVR